MSSLESELESESGSESELERARPRSVRKDGCHSWLGVRSVGQEMFGSPGCELEDVEVEVILELSMMLECSCVVFWGKGALNGC